MGQFSLAAPLPWGDRWRAPAPLRRVHGMDAVADLLTAPGGPAAWDNSGKLASAVISSGRMRWTGESGAGDNCDYAPAANYNAPVYKLPLDALYPTQQCSVAVHVSSPSVAGLANYEMAGILLREQDNPALNGYWAECLFGRTGVGGGATGYQIRTARAIGGAPLTLVNTDIADLTGAWIRMTITPTGIVHFDYRLTTDQTYPVGAQWTSAGDTAQVFGLAAEVNLEVCLMMIAVTDPPTGRIFDFNRIMFNYGGGPA